MPLGFVVIVVAVCSLLDHPRLFMLSLKDEDAMFATRQGAAMIVCPSSAQFAFGGGCDPQSRNGAAWCRRIAPPANQLCRVSRLGVKSTVSSNYRVPRWLSSKLDSQLIERFKPLEVRRWWWWWIFHVLRRGDRQASGKVYAVQRAAQLSSLAYDRRELQPAARF